MHQTFSALKKHIFWLGSLLPAIATAIIANKMIDLNSQRLLWGYLPFWLFAGAWGALALGIVAWRQWRGHEPQWRRLGLSTLSGVLLGLGFPGVLPAPWLLFIAWVPLLLLAEDLHKTTTRPARKLLPYVYHTAVVWNIISTYWVANAALAAGLFAILVNSLLMALPWVVWAAGRAKAEKLGYAPLIAYWFSFEYLHYHWDLTWPWLTLGNGFAEKTAWIQWYEYTGVFGGSLWVWLANLLALRLYCAYREKTPFRQNAIRLALLLALPAGYSLYRYTAYRETGPSIDVVAVQPNYEPHHQKFDLPQEIQLAHFIELSRSKLAPGVDYLVFPESSFGYVEETRIGQYPTIVQLREAFANYPDLKIVTGLNAYYDFPPGAPLTPAARERRSGGRVIHYEALNSAAQFAVGADEVETYRKSKLVPGPEAFPFQSVLFFMKPLVEQLDGTTAGLGIQDERSVFKAGKARIAPVICYESVFGEYFAGYVRPRKNGAPGAQAAFVVTNDGWWDNTAGHRQHLHFARLRAIETRRPIVRSANTGISAFINQRGDVLQTLPYNQAGALRGQMTLNDELTFYTIWGDMIARIALFLAIILALNTFVRSRLPKKE